MGCDVDEVMGWGGSGWMMVRSDSFSVHAAKVFFNEFRFSLRSQLLVPYQNVALDPHVKGPEHHREQTIQYREIGQRFTSLYYTR